MDAALPLPQRPVRAIASQFSGPSLAAPSSAAHHEAVQRERLAQGEAAAAAAAAHHDWRSSGDDVLAQHHRMQQLDTYALRTATREALSNLAQFRGSHALALAWTRASLGLVVSDADVEMLAGSGLPLDFTAASIDAARAAAWTAADDAPPPPLPPPPPLARPLPQRSLDQEAAGEASAAAAAAANAAAANAAAASEHERVVLEAEAGELMGLMTELLQQHGRAMSLGELSSALHARTKQYWGREWEPRHGSLLAFVKAHGVRGVHVLTHNQWLSLAGMAPLPAASDGGGPAAPTASSGAMVLHHSQPPPAAAAAAAAAYPMVLHSHAAPQPLVLAPPPHGYGQPHMGYAASSSSTSSVQQQEQWWQQHQQHQQFAGGDAWGWQQQLAPSTNPFDDYGSRTLPPPPAQQQQQLTQARGPSTSISGTSELVGRRTFKTLMAVETTQLVNELPSGTASGHTRVPSRSEARVLAPPPPPLPALPPTQQLWQLQPSQQQLLLHHHPASHAPTAPPAGYFYSTDPPAATTTVLLAMAPPPAPYYDASSGGGVHRAVTTTTTTVNSRSDDSHAATSHRYSGGGTGSGGRFERDAEALSATAAARSPASPDDEGLSWADWDALFKPLLAHGITLTKHGRSGPPKTRRMWFSASWARLFWASDSLMAAERYVDLADVYAIVVGPGTDLFKSKRARGALYPGGPGGDERYFSLLTAMRSLDFEAQSANQAKVLVRALAFLVSRGGNPIARASGGRRIVHNTVGAVRGQPGGYPPPGRHGGGHGGGSSGW